MFKVLIVDDEEIIREGLRCAIDWKSMGCQVISEAQNGDEGIEMVRSLEPDIVFADIRMPGLNGLEMISKIQEQKHFCKIIILTGFRDFEYAQEAVRLGAFRFLLKPTKIDELIKAVEEAVKELKKAKYEQDMIKYLRDKVKEQYILKEKEPDNLEANDDTSGKNLKYLASSALNYMKANFSQDINLKSVADELYISTWYLSKLLKKETGSNFIDLLNFIRIEEAKKLILEPRYKVYEIALLVGYQDVAYFTKLFKKITGLSPMEYKNKQANIKELEIK